MKANMPTRQWVIGPHWTGEDAFIVAGGTSVKADVVARLRFRTKAHVIAVNNSYLIAPFAEILFFGDDRWWRNEIAVRPEVAKFAGQIVTVGRHTRHPVLWHMNKIAPDKKLGVTREPNALVMEATSLQGAINIAYHKDARRIILIGADNRDGDNGRIHHHEEHPWERRKESWNAKAAQVGLTVRPLADAGIEVINASLISTFPWWPKVDLATWLGENKA
jgi:hypothetical protein